MTLVATGVIVFIKYIMLHFHLHEIAFSLQVQIEIPFKCTLHNNYWTVGSTMKRIITFGTYDLLHVGHIRLLKRAAALGDHLTVGISSDELNISKKGRGPVYSTAERLEIISALDCVDEVFVEHSLEAKGDYIKEHQADVLVMGDDWAGKFDMFNTLCDVVYLPRTEGISTTYLISSISDVGKKIPKAG